MIERKYHRSLQLFSWVACGAMAVKLVLFTEYGTQRRRGPAALGLEEPADAREPPPHVFTAVRGPDRTTGWRGAAWLTCITRLLT